MKVVIFGATGIAGKAVVKEALAKGHQVTILTRDAKRVSVKDNNLTVVEGSAMNRQTVSSVLQGQDAVIQTLGIGGKGNGKPTTIVSDANRVIMDEMERAGVKRLIAISVMGAGNSIAFLPGIFRKFMLPVFMKWFQAVIDDKNRMEPMIMNSSLNWTIVRCTTIKDKPATGKITASLDGKGLKLAITAADMAAFMIGQLTDTTYLRQAPTISN